MVYCEQSMCESKLGRLMQAFRADRPSEWQMDEFIGMAEQMHKMNQELQAAMEDVLKISVLDVVSSEDFWDAFNKANTALVKAKGITK